MLIYFFAGIQMSAAKVKQQKNRGGLPRGGAGEICEVGSETSRLVGARERRGGQGEASQAHLSARRGSVRVDGKTLAPERMWLRSESMRRVGCRFAIVTVSDRRSG